mgnify:CR=1 FL=1|tara:strand:+ start:17289 stop:17627 length:339 start_codon:yes stop_codon:yes gene_type:complete
MRDDKIKQVEEWAEERGLLVAEPNIRSIDNYAYNYNDVQAQTMKLMEEVGETVKAIAYKDSQGVMDGIGDCMVVLIVLAAQHNMTLEECLEHVWDEIKDRTGKLEDGLFKKD